MRFIFSLFLLFTTTSLFSQTLWLGSPNVGTRMFIVDGPDANTGSGIGTNWLAKPTVQLTLDSVFLSQGSHIWCSGVQGNPNANGHHMVRSIVGNSVTLENLDHSDAPAYAGKKEDADITIDGNQWGYCHELAPFELNASPRLHPKQGAALYNRLFGVGGPGSATGTLSRTTPQYEALIDRANVASTSGSPGPCNGNDAATCPKEEALLNGGGAIQTSQGDAAIITALAWSLTGNINYRNSAIYYLKNIERIIATDPTFSSFDISASGGGRGEDGEYSAWRPMMWAYAYDLVANVTISGVWDTAEKATLRKKLFENKVVDGCTNSLGPLGGEITMTKGSRDAIVPDSGAFAVGQWIYVKTRQNRYKTVDNTLDKIVVTGNTAVVTLLREVSNVVKSTPIRVSGSGTPAFDGVWFISSESAGCNTSGLNCPKTFSFTVTGVPSGTYNAPTLEVYSYYNISGASGEMFRVTEIRDANIIRLSAASGYHGINSPWGVANTTVSANTCSVSELAATHGYSPGYHDRSVRLQLSPVPDATTTTFKAPVAAVQNFRNVTLPIVYQYYNEMGDVTAVDFVTGDLTVERGKYNTTAYNHAVAPGESGIMYARRHGWDGSSWTLASHTMTGTVNNLLTSKNAPQITMLFAFAHESAIARADLELMWNYLYDTDLQQLKRLMVGLSPGGSTSGYAGERFGGFLSRLSGTLIHAVNPPIDLVTGKEWLHQISCFMPYASIPWASVKAKPYHISAADSGNDYFYENDDWSVLAFNSHFSAGGDCQQWGYNFLGDNGIKFFTEDLKTTTGEENLWNLIVYTSPTTPSQNYKSAPLSYFFDKSDTPAEPSRKYKALSSRTDWSDPTATLWWINYQDASTDHMGTYNLPGSYQVHKNTALLLPGVKGGTTGNDARLQNGLRFVRPPVSALGAGDNEILSFVVKLSDPAPAGGVKVDFETDSTFMVPPASIVVPEGSQQISIPVLAYQRTPSKLAKLTATSANTVDWYARAGNLAGADTSPNTQAIDSVACYPYMSALTSTAAVTTAVGGTPIRCSVSLLAAAGSNGTTVNLSVNLAGASVPASIRVRNGKLKGNFFVSLQPSAAGTLVVTASSSGSVLSGNITVSPIATPVTGIVAAVVGGKDSNGDLDGPTGGLLPGMWYSRIDRVKQTPSVTYTFADTKPAYSGSSVSLSDATKTFLHSRRSGGRDIAVIYDRMFLGSEDTNSATGALPLMLDSFFRGCVCPLEYINNNPATQQTKSGSVFTFRKPAQAGATYGGDAMMTLAIPYTNARTAGDFLTPASDKLSADLILYGNPTGLTEALKVYMPAANVTDTPPTITTVSSEDEYRGFRTSETSPRVVMLRSSLTRATTMSFTASYAGTADVLVDGLEAGTYSVSRDGTPLLSGVAVGTDGVASFSATSPGTGLFRLTQTGATVPVEITDSSPLPSGTHNIAYTKAFNATGGTSPYNWTVMSGALPAGVNLSTSGILSGTPSITGTFTFRVRVTDSASASAEKDFSLFIAASVSPLAIETATLPNAALSQAYSQPVVVSGGVKPYTCSISSGTLPGGLSITTPGGNGCLISGTPSAVGSFSFTVYVQDSMSSFVQRSLTLQVDSPASPVEITTASLTACTVGISCSQTLQASGGVTPYTFTVLSGQLPDGLTLLSNGTISGTPITAGTTSITFQVRDSLSPTPQTAPKTLALTVNAAQLGISPNSGQLPVAEVGTPYSFTFSRVGGTAPFVWSLSGAPEGITMADGTITGTPTGIGDFTLLVSVTGEGGETATATVVLPVRVVASSLFVHVDAAGTMGIATLRIPTIGASTLCPLLVLGSDGRIVLSATVQSGSSIRFAPLEGFATGVQYNVQASCAGQGGSSTFESSEASGNVSLPVSIYKYTGVDNVLVEYGQTAAFGSSTVATCSGTSCATSLTLQRGKVYYVRYSYRNALNAVIRTGPTKIRLIK